MALFFPCSETPSFLFILCSLLLCQTSMSSISSNSASPWECPRDQKTALLQLKQGFSIARINNSSSRLDSWNPDTACCSWEGITCDEARKDVIGLELVGSGFNWILGRVDASLFCIKTLQHLNLAWNNFDSNPIPPGLHQLTNLTYLNLSNLVGQVPQEISQLKKLVTLDLSGHIYLDKKYQLELKNPNLTSLVQDLPNLRVLYLDRVNLSAHWSEWGKVLSSSVPKLRKLSLFECNLKGPLDPSLSQLHFLEELRLSRNNFLAEVPSFFGDFSFLKSLYLSECGLYGKLPHSVFLGPSLQALDLSKNPLLTIDLPEFPESSVIQHLSLSNTVFPGKLPQSFENLKVLKELHLQNCNFSGKLPSLLMNLTQLQKLDLSSNNFSGPIPSFLGEKLLHLTTLDLYNNSLEGTIPSSLFSHPSLRTLNLQRNQLSGWLDDLHNVSSSLLTIISLKINKLHGSVPRSVFELELQRLNLYSNNFSGILDINMFCKLSNLELLDLSDNRLSIINGNASRSSSSPSKLQVVRLRSCNMTEFPNILQNQSWLWHLDLSNNNISGKVPNWIWKLGNGDLFYLNLSHNSLERIKVPLHNSLLGHLNILDLHSNMFQGPLPNIPPFAAYQDYSNNRFSYEIPADTNFTFIKYFFVSNNRLSGEIPLSICNKNNLQVLELSNNRLDGRIPSCLGEISNSLKILSLRRNFLGGALPRSFTEGCSLRTLNLNGNQLEGLLSRSIVNCKMLEVLDVGNNLLTGAFPLWLGSLSQLRVLVLRSNRFHGPVATLETNYTFPVLQIFDLASNNFTEDLPSNFFQSLKAMTGKYEAQPNSHAQYLTYDFGNGYYQDTITVTMKGLELELERILTIFTSVDLSNNHLQGEIPKSIGGLKLLFVFNISQNGFSGSIPSSMGSLTNLESLDLSLNRLSGEIPWQLTSLTFLGVLNLSQNILVGRIPQIRQFLTFSSDSFSGNIGLCGPPLLKECDDDVDDEEPTLFEGTHLQLGGDLEWKSMLRGFGVGYGVGIGIVGWILFLWKNCN